MHGWHPMGNGQWAWVLITIICTHVFFTRHPPVTCRWVQFSGHSHAREYLLPTGKPIDGLPKDKKKYNKSSKGNEVLQPKPSLNTKSYVRRLPKEVAKEKGPVKPKAIHVESKVGKTKILVEDKELKDDRDSDVEGSDGKFKKRNEEVETDVEGNESEKDSKSEEDKEAEMSKESDDSEPGVKDVKMKGVMGNKTVVVSKAKKQMHVSDSSSEEDKVSKLKKVSKKNKQVKDVKKRNHIFDSFPYDDSSSSEEENVLKKKVSKKKRQVKDESSSLEDEDEIISVQSTTLPSSLFAVIRDSQFDMESFLLDIGFSSLHNVYIDTLPQQFARSSSCGTSIFDLSEIPLDDPFVKEWFKHFDPKTLKKIHACDIAEKLVLTKTVDFKFKVNFLMPFANVMGTTDTIKAIVNLTVLRRIREDTNIAGIDWCGFIHKCLQGSSEPNTIGSFYIGPLCFLIEQVIGKLDLHGEWVESELDQTEGFYNVGENVSWTRTSSVPPTRTSSVPPTNKKTFCSMIEEKILMISSEKIAHKDLLKKANAEFLNDEKFIELCKNDNHGFDNVGKKKESVAKDVVNAEKDRVNTEKDGVHVVQEVVYPQTPQRVVTRSSPNKRIIKTPTYLTSPYMNKRTKVTCLIKRLEFVLVSNEETIDSGFTLFNAIITSLKSFSCKNHVRKFLRPLPLKWRAKVTAINEAKDLATLPLDELIGNLRVYEMILASDGVSSKTIKEKIMPVALKANVTRGQTSNGSVFQDRSDKDKDKKEEFNLIVRNLWMLFKKVNRFERENLFGNGGDKFDRGRGGRSKGVGSSRCERSCYGCSSENHFVDHYPRAKVKKASVGGVWSDSDDGDQIEKDATCLITIGLQKVNLNPSHFDNNVNELQNNYNALVKINFEITKTNESLLKEKSILEKERIRFINKINQL
nr:hypothetical protein [Tanacetum cinerariifolium]